MYELNTCGVAKYRFLVIEKDYLRTRRSLILGNEFHWCLFFFFRKHCLILLTRKKHPFPESMSRIRVHSMSRHRLLGASTQIRRSRSFKALITLSHCLSLALSHLQPHLSRWITAQWENPPPFPSPPQHIVQRYN
jgi:hypothetical protein